MSHSVLLICFIESEKANIHCKNKAIKQQEVCCSSRLGSINKQMEQMLLKSEEKKNTTKLNTCANSPHSLGMWSKPALW